MLKKAYLNRQPKIHDRVEVTRENSRYSGIRIGYEYRIVSLHGGYIGVKGDRMPFLSSTVYLNDGDYKIFEYRETNPPKNPDEVHVKQFKLFGITLWKRTLEIYK